MQNAGNNLTAKIPVIGVVLAGGKSSRMASTDEKVDKSFCTLGDKSLIEHVIARLQPQVDRLIINTNTDDKRYSQLELPLVSDVVPGQVGPLAGILTAMEWARSHNPACDWIVSCAADTPFLPFNLVERLLDQAVTHQRPLACASSLNRTHPVIGLWSVNLLEDLRYHLVECEQRKVDRWTAAHDVLEVEFEVNDVDPFININTPDDLTGATTQLKNNSHES